MPQCRILKHFDNVDGWKKGDVVDITDPWVLIEEGKVALAQRTDLYDEEPGEDVEPEAPEVIPVGNIPNISGRLAAALRKNGIETVDELIEYGTEDLDDLNGVGTKSLEFIRKYLG